MKHRKSDIPLSEAGRMLAVKSKTTLHKYAAEGWLTLRKVGGRWMVDRGEVRRAKVLTRGRAAKLAGCSTKTVTRRVIQGLVVPFQPRRSAEPAAGTPPPRFSLEDVATIKGSIQKRHWRKRASATAKGGAKPRIVIDRQGRAWLRALGAWWCPCVPPAEGLADESSVCSPNA